MKHRSFLTVCLVMLLLCTIGVKLTACVPLLPINYIEVDAADLMEGIQQNPDIKAVPVSPENAEKATDFAAKLLKNCRTEGENILLSPVSVMAALSMTANGAEGETLSQMEQTLGMSRQELNGFFKGYISSLAQGEKCKISMADSIWFKDTDSFKVNPDFLQTNADYFGADAYKAPFDNDTLNDINRWVKNNTDGMIENILDSIPVEAVMYLVNALAFEARWSRVYTENEVFPGTFTLENGTERTIDFMYSTESEYIETSKSVGFMKRYTGSDYAFAALLPKEGVTVGELADSLDGKVLANALSGRKTATVMASIPKFETEYDTELKEVLSSMGMPVAFDSDRADFSGLGVSDENIFISRVIHKTFISVAEQGTKAGAATVVEMAENSAAIMDNVKEIYLDRPFVYMLIDTANNIPFFIGILSEP